MSNQSDFEQVMKNILANKVSTCELDNQRNIIKRCNHCINYVGKTISGEVICLNEITIKDDNNNLSYPK